MKCKLAAALTVRTQIWS